MEDLELRNLTYRTFVALGRAPTAEEIATASAMTIADVRAGWRRLQGGHSLVLDRAMNEIRMAAPFSAVPTSHRVLADERWWYANCAWDALGICAALGTDGRIETSCPDCDEQLTVEVSGERVSQERVLFHCLVPAVQWWDDIVFT